MFSLIIVGCDSEDTEYTEYTGGRFIWVRSESKIVDVKIEDNKVKLYYSLCFDNTYDETIKVEAIAGGFSRFDCWGWLKYQKVFTGIPEDVQNGGLFPPKTKTSVVYVIEGEYLGGKINRDMRLTKLVFAMLDQKNDETDSDSSEEIIYESDDEIIEESNYYKIVKSDKLYYCYFYDDNREIIKEEGPFGKQPKVTEIGEKLLRFTLQAGTGIETQWGYYYDTEVGVFSEVFQGLFGECDGKVACVGLNKVLVFDIFDSSAYYKEFSEFEYPFSLVAAPIVNIEFSKDCKNIIIYYLTGEDYQEVNEIFAL